MNSSFERHSPGGDACWDSEAYRLAHVPAQLCHPAAQEQELLATRHFHVSFTVPHELNLLAQDNSRLFYHLLFTASAATERNISDERAGGGKSVGDIGQTRASVGFGENQEGRHRPVRWRLHDPIRTGYGLYSGRSGGTVPVGSEPIMEIPVKSVGSGSGSKEGEKTWIHGVSDKAATF